MRESNRIDNIDRQWCLEQAIQAWKYLEHQEKLTAQNIKETHRRLMPHMVQDSELGVFRDRDIWTHGIKAPLIGHIDRYINEWAALANTDKSENEIHFAHVTFEHIHPFSDGNGRLGRMLMNKLRLRAGHDIYVIKKEDAKRYYTQFRRKEYPKKMPRVDKDGIPILGP